MHFKTIYVIYKMPNYKNGVIYALHCEGHVYYGSTTVGLQHRYRQHKCRSNESISRKLFEIGEKVEIDLLEKFPCASKYDLEERERWYILNFSCINIRVPNRTIEEIRAADLRRYVARRDQNLAYKKIYNKHNRSQFGSFCKLFGAMRF